MFRRFVLSVLRSYEGRRLIDQAVRAVLEDEQSNTRKGMMRIVRGVATDAVQDAKERERDLAELDAGYQEWAQQRRQALLEEERRKNAAFVQYVSTGQEPAPEDPLAPYWVDRVVRVVQDALFEGRIGRVVGSRTRNGFPEVSVELDGHNTPMTFTPAALMPLNPGEEPPPVVHEDPEDAQPAELPTELIPTITEQ